MLSSTIYASTSSLFLRQLHSDNYDTAVDVLDDELMDVPKEHDEESLSSPGGAHG